jgi:hypothetical protein
MDKGECKMSKEIATMQDMQIMAQAACKSGLFAMPSPEAALTLMLLCQAEGLHPIQALRQYHIIKGRPAMRADAMQAAFQNAGGKIQWHERNDEKASATFSHPAGGDLTVTWTIEQAKKAGLTGNPTWQKFPRAMMSARVVSEGCRAVYPAVVCGLYEPSEIMDFDDEPVKTTRKAKTPETAQDVARNVPVDTKHAEPEKTTPVPAKIAEPTLADKTIGAAKPADEFAPEDAEIVNPIPELKAADRPTKSASEMANELMKLRELAIKAGCKNSVEIKELYEAIAGRALEAATSLSDAERETVKARLLVMIAEKEANANG